MVLALIVASGPSGVQALDFRNGERVEAAGSFTDSLFAAGREVVLELTSTDDVFAAGRRVQARQVRADHLFAGAADFTFGAGEVQDAVVGAGEARFDGGRVADDLIAAAGTLRLGAAFGVGGSALLTGGEVNVQAPIGGDLSASGRSVRIDAVVGRSADLTAQRLVIGPNARIGGDLTYSAETVEISPTAVVTGRRIARPYGRTAPGGMLAGAIAGAAMALLVFVIGGAILVLAAASAFPGLMDRAFTRLETQPLASVGIGFLLLVIGPALVGLLVISLVGLPLGLLVAALYLAAAPLALATTVYWLGMRARRAVGRGRELSPASGWARFGWSLLAVVALIILGAVPLVGGVVWAIAFVVGLGAVAVAGRHALAHG